MTTLITSPGKEALTDARSGILPPGRSTGYLSQSQSEVLVAVAAGSFSERSEELKSRVESWVLAVHLEQVFDRPRDLDNPFDDVYISALRPDPIRKETLERIKQFYHVEDRSADLDFDDELNV